MGTQKSVRLTAELREQILSDLLIHRFQEEATALTNDYADFAVKLYEAAYPAEQREAMAALPDGWLPRLGHVKAEVGGYYGQFSFDGESWGGISSARPVRTHSGRVFPFPNDHRHTCHIRVEAKHPLHLEHQILWERKDDLYERIMRATKEAKAALNAVTSTARLIDGWPEIAPFVPKPEIKAQLPTIPVDKLNETFDLPVS